MLLFTIGKALQKGVKKEADDENYSNEAEEGHFQNETMTNSDKVMLMLIL
jgi:hypothetical protein